MPALVLSLKYNNNKEGHKSKSMKRLLRSIETKSSSSNAKAFLISGIRLNECSYYFCITSSNTLPTLPLGTCIFKNAATVGAISVI